MLENIEIIFRFIFALQMTFWGLNGFFNFAKVPPSTDIINKFVEACYQTRFIMPTTKTIEIICGILLLGNIAVPFNLMIFAPIIFVISILQLFHGQNPWPVIIPITVPFIILIFFHFSDFILLANL